MSASTVGHSTLLP